MEPTTKKVVNPVLLLTTVIKYICEWYWFKREEMPSGFKKKFRKKNMKY